MRRWLRIGIVWSGALALLLGPLAPASAQASDRLKVMITNLVPLDRADDDFGKDLAKALRELINDFARYQAIEEKEIRDAAKRYKVKMEELDCVLSLQMVIQGVARIAFCGSYTENREDETFTIKGVRFTAGGRAALEIPDRTWHEDDYRAAAQEIAASFDAFVTQIQNAQFCGDFYEMENWVDAEEKCLIALRISPNDTQVRLIYSQLLRRTDRPEQAYEEVLKVIELEPADETALQLAGFLAATQDRLEEAGAHYRQLLQLDPGNVAVRLNIAYELAQGGEPAMATLLVEEGLDLEPDNTKMLLQHAGFATKAGMDLRVDDQPMSMEAAEFIQKGLVSYGKAYETLGQEMNPEHLFRMIAALSELVRLEQALDLTEQVLETHGDEARFWAVNGEILKNLDRADEALLALFEAEFRDPGYPNIKARQGRLLLENGREDEALPAMMESVQKGEQSADVIASMFFRQAVRKGIEVDNWPYALRVIEMAKTFDSDLSENTKGQLDFYYAYALYKQAVIDQAPESLHSAKASRPKFREVARLLGLSHVAAYGRAKQPDRYQQLSDNTQQYIAIQDALIRKGI